MENQISGIAEEFLSLQERSRLVGFCSKLTGNPDVAGYCQLIHKR